MGQRKRRLRGQFHWFKVEALFEEEEEFGMRASSGCMSLIYSYRVKYNGLFALFFLSSWEILSNELMILNSRFSCDFFALIGANLDKDLLQVFSF
ncbi:hypothetical protein ES702_04312 [subsurface metagenome]